MITLPNVAILESGSFELQLNVNCPDKAGFLMKDGRCIGSFEWKGNAFEVSIDQKMTVDGSDSVIVAKYGRFGQAVNSLWSHRFQAQS